jgi:hypothetical protein
VAPFIEVRELKTSIYTDGGVGSGGGVDFAIKPEKTVGWVAYQLKTCSTY